MQNGRLFRHCISQNPAIWLAKNILVYISGTFFPSMAFAQEYS